MKRFLKSKIVLTMVTLIMLASAIAIPIVSSSITRSHAAAPTTSTGGLWATGHDADEHCSGGSGNSAGACHYFQVAVNFVRNGAPVPSLPLLILDHFVTGGEVEASLQIAFSGNVPRYQIVDPRTGFTHSAVPLVTKAGNPIYSAIIVASDITCVGCDNNETGSTPDSDAINARAADIAQFFKAGGGILALAGAQHSNVYYKFLPIPVTPVPVTPPDGSPGGFVLTSVGKSLGLTSGDVNCCQTHNSFQLPSAGTPLQVAETDSAGNAETLISSPSVTTHKTLFILIQGLSSGLSQNDVNNNLTPGFDQSNGIVAYLQSHNFGSADYLDYSYPIDKNGQNQGVPHPYSCLDTFNHSLNQDVRTLNQQIKTYLAQHANQGTDIYLIGDSLGGDIGFGYLAYLKTLGWPSLPNGQLKGVITLDAPLGGIPQADLGLTKFVFNSKPNCVGNHEGDILPLSELVSVFNTSHGSNPLGGMANLLQVIFPKFSVPSSFNNQQLADEAANHNIHALTIGNKSDFGFAPTGCTLPSKFGAQDFISSQYVHNEPPNSGVYGREIDVAPNSPCDLALLRFDVNHGVALTDSTVKQGIVDFINNNNPDPLLLPSQLLA